MSGVRTARTATLAGVASLLLPSAAFASGGWEGIGILIGLMAAPVLVVVAIPLAILLAVKKAQRVAGIVGIIVGVLAALWQLFYFGLEFLSAQFSFGVIFISLVPNVVVFVLSGLLLRSAKRSPPKP